MSSSDEDDCYGNAAKKLQSLKNNYRPEKPAPIVEESKVVEALANDSRDDSIIDLLEKIPDIPDPPVPVAKAPKAQKRRSKRIQSKEPSQDPTPPNSKKKKRNDNADLSVNNDGLNASPSCSNQAGVVNDTVANDTLENLVRSATARGRSRGGRRGRGRRSGGGRNNWRRQLLESFANSIIYSVGNTMEYPDTAEDIPIFSKKVPETEPSNPVEMIDLSSSFAEEDENEELSVKVCWHQTEYVKFNIRKFQKLAQVFEYFSKKESISLDKILLTFKGRILRPDDSPDSINYNIAQFIDGGVVSSSISKLAPTANKENASTSGILLKFQCANVKKPFETYIKADQKLSTAMIKCAEHFDLPFSKLRFVLDGDTISANTTPSDHGLDHGDCIDVNVTA